MRPILPYVATIILCTWIGLMALVQKLLVIINTLGLIFLAENIVISKNIKDQKTVNNN